MSVINATHTDEPAASPTGDGGFVRLRLDLAYDGTDFSGWAWQRGQGTRTVQGVLEEALGVVLRMEPAPRTTCSGRTDAGVHARGQVAHVDLPDRIWARSDADDLVRRLNGVLPHDVRVREVAVAPTGFDARFSPLSRIYRYRICDRPEHLDPLHRREVAVVGGHLRVAAMNEAAAPLVGLHDFGAFCRRREGATTIRTLLRLGFSRTDDGLVVGTIEADAFCHSMVRSLVGALIDVGHGRREPAWLEACLRSGERVPAVHVAPAHGLTLESVVFPPVEELADRAAATRNPRGRLHGMPQD